MDNAYIGWEKALIGTVLHRPEEMTKAEDVRPNDLTGCHQMLWAAMLGLYRNESLEPRALIETLRERSLLDKMYSFDDPTVSGETYILELIAARGGNIDTYIDNVLSHATRKQLETTSGLIVSYARDTHMTAEEALDQAESRIMALRRDRSANTWTTMRDLMSVYIPRLEKMRDGTFVPAYTPSLVNLKSLVSYVEEDEYIVVAARPGDGKSSFLRNEAFELARHGKGVLIFNLENSEIEYARAFLALATGINNMLLKNPRGMSPELYRTAIEAAEQLVEMPLTIKSMGAPSIAEMGAVGRAKIHESKPAIIMVDYVQLIENGMENDNANITKSSTALRGWAINYKIPVIAAAQLNREIEKRGKDATPQLSDLRASGSLEQDATQVWFPRKLWYEPTPVQLSAFAANKEENGRLKAKPPAIPVKFFVEKNRNGPTGITDPILWDKSTGRYTDLAMERTDLNQ